MKNINIQTNQKVANTVSFVSKTSYENFKKCNLKAWLELRNPQRVAAGQSANVGLLAHELAAAKLDEFVNGKDIKSSAAYSKYDETAILKVLEDMRGFHIIEDIASGFETISIEEAFSIEMPNVAEEFKLAGRFDAIGLKILGDQSFMQVLEWKSGFLTEDSLDAEALFYSFAAYKKYGMGVLFTRANLQTGKIVSEAISLESLEALEGILTTKFQNFKNVLEADVEPKFEPGNHCLYCPFIDRCPGQEQVVDTLEDDLRILEWAKQLVKDKDTKLKNAGKEVLKQEPLVFDDLNPSKVLVPGTLLSVTASGSTYWQSASRSVKKTDIVDKLLEADVFSTMPELREKVDVKINDQQIAFVVESLGIPLKKVEKTTVTVKAVSSDEEEEA